MANLYRPHVMVLPEDAANHQLANGFSLRIDQSRSRQFQILPEVGGWSKVLDEFVSTHVREMAKYPHRYMILLIDFDKSPNRLANATTRIPVHLRHRVFVLGSSNEPEDLKNAGLRRSLEGATNLAELDAIGYALAQDCLDNTNLTWGHPELNHNASEVARLRATIHPILF